MRVLIIISATVNNLSEKLVETTKLEQSELGGATKKGIPGCILVWPLLTCRINKKQNKLAKFIRLDFLSINRLMEEYHTMVPSISPQNRPWPQDLLLRAIFSALAAIKIILWKTVLLFL
jgi:hypothetical protein